MDETVAPAPVPLAPQPARPAVWSVFVIFFGVFIGMNVASGFVLFDLAAHGQGLTLLSALQLPPVRLSELVEEFSLRPMVLSIVTVLTSLSFGFSAFFFALFGREPLTERLRLRATSVGLMFVIALGFIGAADALDSITKAYHLDRFSMTLPKLNGVIEQLGGKLAPLGLLVFAVLPGLCEELFFRGLIQSRLVARWGPAVGVVVTSIFFGLAHFDVVHSVLSFLMGLGLGWITVQTRSLWPAVGAHVLNNAYCFADTTGLLRVTLPPGWRFIAMLVLATSAFVLVSLPSAERPRPA